MTSRRRRPVIEFSEYMYEPPALAIVGYRVGPMAIKKGEELLSSYGKGFWRGRGMNGNGDETSNCPGRHGLEQIDIPDGSSYYCSLCSETIDSTSSAGFRYCQRCVFGVSYVIVAEQMVEDRHEC